MNREGGFKLGSVGHIGVSVVTLCMNADIPIATYTTASLVVDQKEKHPQGFSLHNPVSNQQLF